MNSYVIIMTKYPTVLVIVVDWVTVYLKARSVTALSIATTEVTKRMTTATGDGNGLVMPLSSSATTENASARTNSAMASMIAGIRLTSHGLARVTLS